MQRICKTLHDEGFAVTLVGRWRSDSLVFEAEFDHHRIVCKHNSGKLFYIEYNMKLFRYLMSQQFDALCAVDLDTMLAVSLAASRKRKKWTYDAHELFQEVPELVGRPVSKWIWSRLAAWGIPKADAAYTVSESLTEYFQKRYKRPFGVVRNLPYYQKPKSAISSQKILLYQGALNQGRGLELLIDAAPDLNCLIAIAGKGDLYDALRAQAAQSKATAKISFLGSLKPAELAEWTNRAFLGYNVLENRGLSYYFSLANKFFDYTMAGVPCLVSPFPEYEKLQTQYGIGISVGYDRSALIEIVNTLISEPELYIQLRAGAINAAKKLNWNEESHKLIAIYTELFANSRKFEGSL